MSTGFPDWTRAYLLIGSHEGELIPVYVDEDGHLYAALQGEYKGELRTIALDDQGRISAFVIDSSDAWGQMLSVGNAELATRLTRSTFGDARGRVLYHDDFSAGLGGVVTAVSGSGTTLGLSPNIYVCGGYAIRIYCPTGRDHIGILQREFGGQWNVTLGVAINFYSAYPHAGVGLALSLFDGLTWHYGRLYYRGDLEALYYINQDYGWSILGAKGDFPRSEYAWTLFKLVVDPISGEYVRAIFGGQLISMAGLKLYETPSSDPARFVAEARGTGAPAELVYIYLDDYVVSVGE